MPTITLELTNEAPTQVAGEAGFNWTPDGFGSTIAVGSCTGVGHDHLEIDDTMFAVDDLGVEGVVTSAVLHITHASTVRLKMTAGGVTWDQGSATYNTAFSTSDTATVSLVDAAIVTGTPVRLAVTILAFGFDGDNDGVSPWDYTISALTLEVTYAVPGTVDPPVGGTLGADPVTVTGGPFVTGATVTFDGVPSTDVVVVDAETITCVTPAHALGLVDVVVTNPDTSTVTLADAFTYQISFSTPIVDAGQAQIANGPLPSVVTTVATVTRGSNNGTITYAWSQLSGPATATLSAATALDTDLTFDTFVAGIYRFELAVTTEGAVFTATDTLTVIMGPTVPPRVTSGRVQVVL